MPVNLGGFQQKVMIKFYENSKIHFCHFFLFLDFYGYAKFQKLMNRFREKLVTDIQTVEQAKIDK